MRADSLLAAQGLASSRTAARCLIEAGRVRWEGGPVTKASLALPASARLEVAPDADDCFVSRGGLKLSGAMAASGVAARGRICLDVGQSTGGFTDCLLQAGASRVVGVEVGHGQLHPRLGTDARCVTLEGINARHLAAQDLGEHYPAGGFDLIVCDASFISLTLLMPQWPALLADDGDILALVKPQFEVGPKGISKGGIVRDTSLYAGVESRLRQTARQCGLAVHGWFDSPITGTDGNREFFIWMKHDPH
ncbi:TlyA family RNA methyltransferase [Azoarcus sp. L1K30]|uniref:TlyA family RNA methyltransferase n=1 Tax=Azoarcus sp. L1K30 TaxID=2820277 RepID=UPI001B812EC1|nr:TlyA family RNA methyltransferase [Azoarcus sp. L1K30]MBR0566515.1 TlyA family RNA methyltransferase [Azoarcus sp. L1K30]